MPSAPPPRLATVVLAASALYVALTGYLAAEAAPTLFYVGSVFVHWFGGLALAALWIVLGGRALRAARRDRSPAVVPGLLAFVLLLVALGAAVALERLHNTRGTRWLLDLHIVTSVAAAAMALLAFALQARRGGPLARRAWRWSAAGAAAGLLLVVALPVLRGAAPPAHVVDNPERPPFVMQDEAMGGAEGPFFPSSAATSTGGRIPSDFFMTSESCARCHGDIYAQWAASAHHFSSFNNQWYRKSIEYMQEVNSIESARWCAGCHDHAVLFNGMMDRPVSGFLDTQEAHTGLACNSCHAITRVRDTMGNGGFHVEYPPLHDLAVSEDPVLRALHDYAVKLDPGPHRNVFLKPFHREQTAEFCSSCHKVHLDEPVNNYRWLRGFNEYDNWQASGVSGEGARSFYYPAAPQDCADCHMPQVRSDDKGNVDGYVHDHSFLAANTALPVANLDGKHLERTIEFLQRNQVTVDLFAASPARPFEGGAAELRGAQLASTFAVGEESGMAVGGGGVAPDRELGPLWGPLDRGTVTVRRGDDVRVDVVVRTRGVGHFFPGGTVDGFDVWLELRARDETGRTVFWSGVAGDGGSGPVDEGAHRYGNRMVDGRGNRIDKRNAWATRAVAWVNLIPPGAADVAHYRLHVPDDCGEELTLEARLNYRKFSHANTEFSFGGVPAAGEPAGPGEGIDRVTKHWDDRPFVRGDVPMNVSAALREVPDLPIVVMSRATATLAVAPRGAEPVNAEHRVPDDFLRWNDYGIGLLLQGDLAAARRAFAVVTELDPSYADGWVNRARVALREGLLEEAESALAEAFRLEPDLAKTHYFQGVVHKERGEYDPALVHFRRAAEQYPRDRVVRNDIGRVLFLQRRYADAVAELRHVLDIDPEDLMAHYNLMLSYRGLGRADDADAHRRLYERFKADEDADAILGPYLRRHPGDNRMRQKIHEQVSVPADVLAREAALRAEHGEPHVVLPGEGAGYAARVVERGERILAEGGGAARILGPTEAGEVRPAPFPFPGPAMADVPDPRDLARAGDAE